MIDISNLMPPRNTEPENGQWLFPDNMGSPYIGFIYVVFDTVLSRCYIGKKLYISMKDGRTRESDWKTYKTSSKTMKDIWKTRAVDEFQFICLEQYKSKGALSYAETWTLCRVQAPTSDKFYNKRIEPVSWSVKEQITKRHVERIDVLLQRLNYVPNH